MNTKAEQVGNQIMIFPFILILLIIGSSIVVGVYLFFGEEYDFREVDAIILNYKLQECFTANNINLELPREQLEIELFKTCQLNEKVIKDYFFMTIEQNNKIKYSLGDTTQCILAEKNKKFPRCAHIAFNDIKLISGSNQHRNQRIT